MATGVNWDLGSYFDEFRGERMLAFKKEIERDIASLLERASALGPLCAASLEGWKTLVLESEKLGNRLGHLGSYVGCLCASNVADEAYSSEYAALDGIEAEASKIDIQIKMAFKEASDEDFFAFIAMEGIEEIAFQMKELREQAQKTMTSELETLATDLSTDGFSSWGRLYSTIAGKLSFDMHWPDGRVEKTPISQCRSLMQDTDREVRKAAFDNGNAAWKSVEDVCAAALNSIAGARLVLQDRRGIEHFLDSSLIQSRISRRSLDAMFAAIDESKDFIQRIGRAKAKALGLEKLNWYDCEAPLSIPGQSRYSWEDCVKMVDESFTRAYPDLGAFLKEALEKRWVESEPRPGKMPGAFCSSSSLIEESRVFMSYSGSFRDISTLAHEIGHAYHSRQMHGLRPFLRHYPMTLAESASTFAELLLVEGVLANSAATDAQKLGALTGTLNHCIAFLIDIPIRFAFEKSLYEERAKGAVSVSRLKELMTSAMESQFGPLLDEGGADELFWTSKMHFYLTGISFYNYPYTFGYLLSRGLFEMFKREKEAFLPRYTEFLRLSGTDTAPAVARQALGADLEGKDFWRAAILGHEGELKAFEELAPKVLG